MLRIMNRDQMEMIDNYENVKNRILPVARNIEFSDVIPDGIVTKQEGDFIFTYKILLEISREGIASINVSSNHLSKWEMSADVLHSNTMRCLEANYPLHIDRLDGMLAAMTGANYVYTETEEPPLFVVSNNIMYCGASHIFSENVREHLAKVINGGYYILPSSIHEVLVLSDKTVATGLSEMVTDINETQVHVTERMANCVYHYDPKTKLFTKTA